MNERPDTPKPHPPPPLPRAWLGYPEEVLRATCRQAVADGWSTFKMKVGSSRDDDLRRARLIRDEIGPDRRLMMDANQKGGVDEAIERMRHLAAFHPWWIEEPTSPDDVLGHARIRKAIAPIRVATGVPVCPHAGGVGLCEYVQHLALFDYIAVSASLENRVLEYVDHLTNTLLTWWWNRGATGCPWNPVTALPCETLLLIGTNFPTVRRGMGRR